jgi:hypothetical protein
MAVENKVATHLIATIRAYTSMKYKIAFTILDSILKEKQTIRI